MKRNNLLGNALAYAILILGSVIMFFPFYWMLITAVKTFKESVVFPPTMFPEEITLDNFRYVISQTPFLRYMANSLLVSVVQLLFCIPITILGAFALARLKIKGKNIILAVMIAVTMVPFELIVLTNYRTVIDLGLNDNLLALIVPFISSVYYTVILRNSYLSSPVSLYFSAKLDGASDWKYLWKILVPLSKPTLFSISIFNLIASWNSFMWPMLVIKSPEIRTWPFGLFAFATEQWINIPLTMAAACIALIPVLVFFLFTRKYLVASVLSGGLKG